ncbi:MAG: NADP-dependent phosphogluconate dehydrogenase [Cellulophaga sp.]
MARRVSKYKFSGELKNMKGVVILIMGVSGCGKTTIGNMLSDKIGIPFYDGDDFHPDSNIEKMSRGIPLNSADRIPWLRLLAAKIEEWSRDDGAIVACSALKEAYRIILSSKYKAINWVYLAGDKSLISSRIENREGHFMNADLLQSQFNDLEIPEYGVQVDISRSPEKIINHIISNLKSVSTSFFGLIGLGVMGKSLSLNIAEKGHSLSVYNRTVPGEENMVKDFISTVETGMKISGFTELTDFVSSLERPRKILIMIKAGNAIDEVIRVLTPLLSDGDVIIDGGNSHYQDTKRRYDALKEQKIHYVGAGVSGGEEGARKGPSIMVGGSRSGYKIVGPILESIAAIDKNGTKCCTYIGTEGAGHFVKMVHNGIEYAEMQLLAEMYVLLSASKTNEEIGAIFLEWNSGSLSSYLLEITAAIMTKKEGNTYILDLILDSAGNKGTGSWSSKTALDFGTVNSMMSSAVFARYVSSFKNKRVNLSKKMRLTPQKNSRINIDELKAAYTFARIINHQQGFELMRQVSSSNNWNLLLSDISRIWTNGCIIKSELMVECIRYFQDYSNLFDCPEVIENLKNTEAAVKTILIYGLENRIPLELFSAAQLYWVAMTTERLPANMIQAQRDYFGAHTYQRIDALESQFFHTKW